MIQSFDKRLQSAANDFISVAGKTTLTHHIDLVKQINGTEYDINEPVLNVIFRRCLLMTYVKRFGDKVWLRLRREGNR